MFRRHSNELRKRNIRYAAARGMLGLYLSIIESVQTEFSFLRFTPR
jgi:hypothetical protein